MKSMTKSSLKYRLGNRRRKIDGVHPASMGDAYKCLVHPEQVINRDIGGAFVGRRPGASSIFAREYADFCAEIYPVLMAGVH
jgi:hypothetical protein